MEEGVPPPVYTFRGHQVGVSALASIDNKLISGDQEGSICFWSLSNFRRLAMWPKVMGSKIQSLNTIRLLIKSTLTTILVCQSRDHGVKLFICEDVTVKDPSTLIIREFPTYEALFSRGHALTISENKAILAYPSSIEGFMVTIRYLGLDAQILLAGNASRSEEEADEKRRRSTVFDIKLMQNSIDSACHHVFTGYEDGIIVIYSTSLEQTKTVPVLDVTGLKIDVIKRIDMGLTDFVAAFDVRLVEDNFVIVSGSPQKVVSFCYLPIDFRNETIKRVALKKQGTSAVTIRPDSKLVAVANWDNSLKLYSMKSRALLVTLSNHVQQIHSIIFTTKAHETREMSGSGSHLMCCASLDGTISAHDIY